MGRDSCSIYISSTAQYLEAEITWDSNYYVTVYVLSNTSWRLKPQEVPGDSGNIFAQYGHLGNGEFQGTKNGTYVFQIENKLDGEWAQDTFTLTSDSPGEGGGDTNPNYSIWLKDGGNSWDDFPKQAVYWLAINEKLGLPTLSKSPDKLSTNIFTIKGHSNGGVDDVALEAEATTYKEYIFLGWFDEWNNLQHNPYIVKGHAILYAHQHSVINTSYSNNTLEYLEKPTKNPVEKNYTVKYNSAGGTASKTQEQVTQILSYDFDYWCSDSSGTGKRYDDSSSFIEETEVWAIWKEQIQKESQIVLPTVVKYGYKFKGWSLSGQSVLYPAETTVKINGNVEFTAIWEPYGFGYLYCEETGEYRVALMWIYAPSGATDTRPWKLAIPNIKTDTNWKITAG